MRIETSNLFRRRPRPPARARIRVECDGDFDTLRVFAVPLDGGPELELPVCSAMVAGEAGEPLFAELRLYPGEVRLRDRATGRTLAARGSSTLPALYPNLIVDPPDRWITSFRYGVDYDGFTATLEVDGHA